LRQGYYAQITKIDYDKKVFYYRNSAGFIIEVPFSRVMGSSVVGGESNNGYNGYNGYNGSGKTVYDYYSPNDFYRKEELPYAIWDHLNANGNILYNGVEYSTKTYFQLPDAREMVPYGLGQNTTSIIARHNVTDITNISSVTINNVGTAGVLNKISLYPVVTY